MLTTILLADDPKFAAQLETWLRQVAPDKMRTETHLSLDSYTEMLGREAEAVSKSATGIPTGTSAPKIGLFIIDADLMGLRPINWLENLQETTREKAPFLFDEKPPKVLVMAYEGGTPRLEIFQSEFVDDLILKPIDKTLFQQKVEILIGDSQRFTPHFLFRAKTEEIIEIGHDIEIDEVSEFAVGVRCVEPLKVGTFATIHADLFGEKSNRRLIGRVFESVKHPVREGEYLARFSLLGLKPNQISKIRHFIRANQTSIQSRDWSPPGPPVRSRKTVGPGSRLAAIPKGKVDDSGNEKTEEPARIHKIAIIDMNAETREEAKSILESNFKNVSVKSFSSFARLAEEIKRFNLGSATATAPAPEPMNEILALLEDALPGGKKLSVFLDGRTHELIRFEPFVKKTEKVLGQSASHWMERPDRFKASIDERDREAFEEFLTCIESGAIGKIQFRFPMHKERLVYLEAVGRLEKTGVVDGTPVISIELSELSADEWRQKVLALEDGGSGERKRKPEDFQFDVILIESAYLRAGPTQWFDDFIALLRSARILKSADLPPKIFVMADLQSNPRVENYRVDGIIDFLFKPLDRRLLVQKLRSVVPTLLLTREIDPHPWIPTELPALLGREALMEELAEYGLVIRHSHPFEDRAFLRFFTTLFGDEVWILGRHYSSEKVESTGDYRCQFLFFGHSDELLKRIRRWIREDYVAQKEAKA